MPRKTIHLPLYPVDFPCLNCDQPMTLTSVIKLYCSDLCSEEAHFVRYFRACKGDGRVNQPDVKEALRIRLGHIRNGGYRGSERRIPLAVRRAVRERYKGLCQECGEPGTDIDHIDGSSNELENLRLLCKRCHNEKTLSKFVLLPPEDEEEGAEIRARDVILRLRVDALTPVRICDDEKLWRATSKQIMAERRHALREERLKYKKMSKAEETKVDIDLLTEELNEYGRLKEQLEVLGAEEKEEIGQFYTPEIRARVEEIEAKFAARDESLKKEIAVLYARIRERVAQYGETVNGMGWQAVCSSREGSWDTEAINNYAETHPEILAFRTSWDLDAIDEYAETHPEILVCRTESQSVVSIRKIQRKPGRKSTDE
jgi:hypothetical protein